MKTGIDKDIRRLVTHASVFDNMEKSHILRRVFLALDALGVQQVIYMPDYDGLVAKALEDAWASGRLQAPGRPGINFMLSEKNRVPVGPDTVIAYGPHLMFYAPHLDDADIGGDRTGAESPVFMINSGSPSGYVIVPVGEHAEP